MHSSQFKYWNIVVHVVVISVKKKQTNKKTPFLSTHVFVCQFEISECCICTRPLPDIYQGSSYLLKSSHGTAIPPGM